MTCPNYDMGCKCDDCLTEFGRERWRSGCFMGVMLTCSLVATFFTLLSEWLP